MGGPYLPVDRIKPVAPSPSLLTSAVNRTSDAFGRAAGAAPPDGATDAELELWREAAMREWRTGISWVPHTCQQSYLWPRCPVVTVQHGEGGDIVIREEKEAPDATAEVHTEAFVVYTPLECEWITKEAFTLDADATALTEAHTAWAMAQALWLGAGLPAEPDQPSLRRAGIVPGGLEGTTLDLDDAVSILLAAYEGCTGGSGGATLHVPSVLATGGLGGIPGGGKIATPEGNLYRGPLGSVVCFGPGYPNGASADGDDGFGPYISADPDDGFQGNAQDEAWVYVTGRVEYALGTTVVLPKTEAEQRGFFRQNHVGVWAERPALVRFDPCCTYALKVNVPVEAVS